uniref:Uncharacterized protein n=1 Tax=Arion vulgaris TaxID=1028688 RepID=A0A0B7AHU6_9EUPU
MGPSESTYVSPREARRRFGEKRNSDYVAVYLSPPKAVRDRLSELRQNKKLDTLSECSHSSIKPCHVPRTNSSCRFARSHEMIQTNLVSPKSTKNTLVGGHSNLITTC